MPFSSHMNQWCQKLEKEKTNISQLILSNYMILTRWDLQKVGGKITRNKCVVLTIWNYQPLLNTYKANLFIINSQGKISLDKNSLEIQAFVFILNSELAVFGLTCASLFQETLLWKAVFAKNAKLCNRVCDCPVVISSCCQHTCWCQCGITSLKSKGR